MKRLIKLIVFLILLGVAIYLISNTIKTRVGDIRPALLPNININSQINQKQEGNFTLPETQTISVFAKGLGAPRDLVFSPEGTLFASIPGRGQVVAIFDENKDGVSDQTKIVVTDLTNPHGLYFFDNQLFVASEEKVVSYTWNKTGKNLFPKQTVLVLPPGGRHSTRTLEMINNEFYISLGSSCDTCFEKNSFLASVIKTSLNGTDTVVFSEGLRNSVFIKRRPGTEELWATEMGRDFLGDDLPPDEINILKPNTNYGWPVCYGNKIYDLKFGQLSPSFCNSTEPPVFEIQAHSAPLGLNFIESNIFPETWQGDLLVAYHGSWNRSSPVGYKVVRLDLEGDKVVAEYDYLTGFITGSQAIGRPVDLEFSPNGDLYLSDDKAGVIYRITKI